LLLFRPPLDIIIKCQFIYLAGCCLLFSKLFDHSPLLLLLLRKGERKREQEEEEEAKD